MTKTGDMALAQKYLLRELSTVIGGSNALHILENDGGQAAVILELVCAIVNANSRSPAGELIVGAFIDVLKASPAAHVINEDAIEVCLSELDVINQLLKALASRDSQTAAPFIRVG